ncbi:hypothetical protein [Pedococcus soli]
MLPWRSIEGTSGLIEDDPLLSWFRASGPQNPFMGQKMADLPAAFATRSSTFGVPVVLAVDRTEPEHMRWAWNVRSLGVPIALIDQAMTPPSEEQWGDILSTFDLTAEDAGGTAVLVCWDLTADSSEAPYDLAKAVAYRSDSVQVNYMVGLEPPPLRQCTVTTPFEEPFQVSLPYGAMRTSLSLPAIPLAARPNHPLLEFHTVAAEVQIERVVGSDPRLVGRVPADPAFSDLLEHVTDDMPRALRPTEDGYVAGVRASTRRMRLQLHRKADVFSRLFVDGCDVSQSDDGLFQTRAGELLGGSASGALSQPGMAAALRLLAGHPTGVPPQRIKNEIAGNLGSWPGDLWRATDEDYADDVFNHLMRSGMINAVLKAKCLYCRAWMYLEPQALAHEVHCDFCGQDVKLAPILASRAHTWQLRLAGHLGQAQVQAMIPVLATVGQLAHLTQVEGGLDCHDLGLMVMKGSRRAEADVVAILPGVEPALVLGEVKSRNRVDAKDVGNLEWLRDNVRLDSMRTQLLFATTKDDFGDEERALLRDHCQRQAVREDEFGRPTVAFPLLLTGRDLFLPWMDDDNIWRAGPGRGLSGIAEESCRRRLGLDWWRPDLDSREPVFSWAD